MLNKLLFHLKIFVYNIRTEISWDVYFIIPKKERVIRVFNDFRYHFTQFGYITRVLYSKSHIAKTKYGFEYKTFEAFEKYLKQGDIVIDIGANVGVYSLLSSSLVGEKGQVIAFEPSKITFDALNENIHLNRCKNISSHQLALSNTEGVIRFGAVENDAMNFIDINNSNNIGEQVPMNTLDNFVQNHKIERIDFIKIDIEGAELLCFEGSKNTLTKMRPIILMECNENWCKRFGHSVFDVLAFLNSLGYSFENYDENQWLCFPKKNHP
jgi:FkbM family methyltransferase